jgi:hypothetical protein
MDAAWCGRVGQCFLNQPARHGACSSGSSRGAQGAPAPGSRYLEAITLPRLSSKKANSRAPLRRERLERGGVRAVASRTVLYRICLLAVLDATDYGEVVDAITAH